MSQVHFELNETTLVFQHDGSTSGGQVSQVTLNYPKQVLLTKAALDTFNDKKARISEEIHAILKLDCLDEFPTPSLVKADGYSLLVESRPWEYGRTIRFSWGDQRVPAASRKWAFTFVPKEQHLAAKD